MPDIGSLPLVPLLDPAFWQDPHAVLRAARRTSPVARTPGGSIVLLDHDDVVAALGDPRLVNDYDALLTRHGITDGPLWDWWKLAMLNNNPPVHTRLRGLVSRAFTPRAVARAAAPTREHARRLLAPACVGGRIELVTQFCEPLPIAVLCDLVGVPRDEAGQVDSWIAELGLMFSETMDDDIRRRAETAMTALQAYVGELARQRSCDRGDDLVSALLAAEDDGERLSRAELVAMVVNLLFGALDTTRGALSMAGALLATRPDLQAALRDRTVDAAAFVEELLRHEPPVGQIDRVTTERVGWHGVEVPAGAVVAMSVLAANRDPARYDEPDTFDPTRFARANAATPVLSFGRGIHHCVGSALARLELREALTVLVDELGPFAPADDRDPPRLVPFRRVRCVERLDLACH